MKNLQDISLKDILPDNFKSDVKSLCFAVAFDEIYKIYTDKINKVRFFSRIESLNDVECDLLAVELHCDSYNKEWSLSQKREACRNSYKWHLYKGTVFVLKDFVRKIYGDAKIEEWFEYNGFPYHYRSVVELFESALNSDTYKKLFNNIEKYKNARSRCDGITTRYSTQAKQKIITFNKISINQKILPKI